MRQGLIAIVLTIGAPVMVAHADGSGSAAPKSADIKKIPEEEAVAPTGLIIAGVALAAFALLLLLGRRKKSQPAKGLTGDLAEVRLVIETDERALVWTTPSLKIPTDRVGEVVLHLPIGTHTVNVQIGDETFRRTIQVPAIRRMRLPINFTKERISRASSGEMAAASPSVAPMPSKPPTSMARAYPESSKQGELGAQLAGLIDVELDAPVRAASALPLDTGDEPGAIDFSPQRSPSTTKSPPLSLDFSTPAPGTLELDDPDLDVSVPVPEPPARSSLRDVVTLPRPKQPTVQPAANALEISLDDITPVESAPLDLAPPQLAPTIRPPEKPGAARPSKAEAAKAASAIAELDVDLGSRPRAPVSIGPVPDLDLAPPERRAAQPIKPSIDVEVGSFSQPVIPATLELPKESTSSVMDLMLDEDELPLQKIPVPRPVAKPTPDIGDFEIEDTPPPQVPRPATRATPSPTASRPVIPPISGGGVIGNRYRKTGGAGAAPLGALYRGRDESAGRDVWIEELPRELALAVPAATLVKLEHANILKFYEHVVDATKSYVVTEMIEGKSLDQLLTERGGTMSSLEAIGIVDQVCAALAYAHDRGAFHRNVRPACIWICGRVVKLTGFGMTLGKPTAYQAPELSTGSQPDVRTDLYSVGVTIAQLLTGAMPAGKLDFPADVSRNLAGLIRKLVSHEPMIRPNNVKVVRDAFSALF